MRSVAHDRQRAVGSDIGRRAQGEMRRDRDGVTWAPRRDGASARQRNAKGAYALEAPRHRRALAQYGLRGPIALTFPRSTLPVALSTISGLAAGLRVLGPLASF